MLRITKQALGLDVQVVEKKLERYVTGSHMLVDCVAPQKRTSAPSFFHCAPRNIS